MTPLSLIAATSPSWPPPIRGEKVSCLNIKGRKGVGGEKVSCLNIDIRGEKVSCLNIDKKVAR